MVATNGRVRSKLQRIAIERSRDAEHNTGCNDYCKTLKHREHWVVMVCEGHVESVDEINYTVDGVFDIRKEQA